MKKIMASYELINRAIAGLSAGMPCEDLRVSLLSNGDSEYDCWLAFKAAQVAIDQSIAFSLGESLEEFNYIAFKIKEEEAMMNHRYEILRDDR